MKYIISLVIILLIGLSVFYVYSNVSPVDSKAGMETFIITRGNKSDITERLYKEGYINSTFIFNLLLTINGNTGAKPGGYIISRSMRTDEIAKTLSSEPSMIWITFPEGLRKEQIGEKLAKEMKWSREELEKWNTVYTAMEYDSVEGVYFPDTYLIPVNESGLDIAKRMQRRFNEQFEPYLTRFGEKDILWTTGLKLASLIQREAAGKDDMPLIAGVLWNRLFKGQRLEIDATVQYAKGKTDDRWWGTVTPEDIRSINSKYNTYKYKGLPPHPICNPGLDAIEAVLEPEETDCLFYLHDNNSQIHCAVTYEEHLQNIEKYLR